MNNITIKTIESIEKNSTSQLNGLMRSFYQNSRNRYLLIHNSKTEIIKHTEESLNEIAERYINIAENTNIQFLAGKLQPITVIDYGNDVKISVGSIVEQKINTVFLTREVIESIGYFDVRYTDNCVYGDYVNRLSNTNLYPSLNLEKLPWVFDCPHIDTQCSKHVFEGMSSGWYQYKYKMFPQQKTTDTIDNLKLALKAHKKQQS